MKPIVCLCGAPHLYNISFNRYINAQDIGSIVYQNNTSDICKNIAAWIRYNNIKSIDFKPNYDIYKQQAVLICYQEMIEYADYTIIFWDGKDNMMRRLIDYSQSIDHKCITHLIIEY